jgi:hypothetical protein
MSLPKVYLAKSNRANPNLVSKVRQALSKFNVQIVEYTGGSYSSKQMLECEQLVVVPDLSDEDFIIGKGLYNQITEFRRNKGLEYVMVLCHDSDDLLVGDISSMEVIDEDDYIAYGELTFDYETEKLVDIFNDIYDLNSNFVHSFNKNPNSNYYHLIAKKT